MYKKIKTGLKKTLTALTLATVLYSSAPVQAQPILERPLTQQTEEYYKNPEKEFRFYMKTFKELSEDRVIDTRDTKILEYVLDETLKEIEEKKKVRLPYEQYNGIMRKSETQYYEGLDNLQTISDEALRQEMREELDQLGESIDKYNEAKLGRPYFGTYDRFVNEMKNELDQLRKHLEMKDEWLRSDYRNGKYWSYGVPPMHRIIKGNVKNSESRWETNRVDSLDGVFENNLLHQHILDVDPSFKTPHIQEFDREFPGKTKLPQGLGLLLGLLVPLAAVGVGHLRRKKLADDINSGSYYDGYLVGMRAFVAGASAFLGTAFIDFIHPLVYPIRLALPWIYEEAMILMAKKENKNYQKWKVLREKEEAEKIEAEPEDPKKELIKNPFDYDIPTIDNTIKNV